jgi:hypothetical protein
MNYELTKNETKMNFELLWVNFKWINELKEKELKWELITRYLNKLQIKYKYTIS